jgi:MFS family permease
VNRAGRSFLLLVQILPAMAFTALIPVLPAIETHFRSTPDASALTRALVSSLSIAMILGSLCAGMLGARFGNRQTIFGALLVYAVAGGIGGLSPSLMAMLASRFILGLAAAVIATLSIVIVAQSFTSTERDRWMGWIAAASTIGSLTCMPLAGAIAGFGWRYVFLLFLLALPFIILGAIGLPHTRSAPPVEASTPVRSAGFPRQAWALAPLAIGLGAVMNATPMFLPFHLAEIGVNRPSLIAAAMLTNALAGTLIALAYGKVRRHLSMPRIFALSLIVGAAGLALVSLSNSYGVILAALCILGLGLGIMMPNLNGIAAAISTPEQAGKIIGLATACLFAGGPIVQFCLDMTINGEPASVPLMIVAIFALLLGLVWLAMDGVFQDRAAPTPALVS